MHCVDRSTCTADVRLSHRQACRKQEHLPRGLLAQRVPVECQALVFQMFVWGLLSAEMQQGLKIGNTSQTAYLQSLLALLPQPRHPAMCRQVWDVSSAKCL